MNCRRLFDKLQTGVESEGHGHLWLLIVASNLYNSYIHKNSDSNIYKEKVSDLFLNVYFQFENPDPAVVMATWQPAPQQ